MICLSTGAVFMLIPDRRRDHKVLAIFIYSVKSANSSSSLKIEGLALAITQAQALRNFFMKTSFL